MQKMIYVKNEELHKLTEAMDITKTNLSNTVMQALDNFIETNKGENLKHQVLQVGGEADLEYILMNHRPTLESIDAIFQENESAFRKFYELEEDEEYGDDLLEKHLRNCFKVAQAQFRKEKIGFFGKKLLNFTHKNTKDELDNAYELDGKMTDEQRQQLAIVTDAPAIRLEKQFLEEATNEMFGGELVNTDFTYYEDWGAPDAVHYSLYQTSNGVYLLHIMAYFNYITEIRSDIGSSVADISDYVIIKDINSIKKEVEGEFLKTGFLLPKTVITQIKSAMEREIPYRLLDLSSYVSEK